MSVMYAEVFLDIPNRRLDQSYFYSIPENINVELGSRVLVPLQNRKVQGLIVNIVDEVPKELSGTSLRPIVSIVDSDFPMPEELVHLALWLSETTICSIAQSLHTVWPFLKGKVDDWIVPLFDKEDSGFQALQWLDQDTFKALTVLLRSKNKALPVKTFLKRAKVEKEFIEQMKKQGWIKTESKFSSGHKIIKKNKDEFSPDEPVLRENDGLTSISVKAPAKSLTLEQKAAVQEIMSSFGKDIKTILLHGVTGSGKTEVYRKIISEVLKDGGDAILLVPEISLTPQISEYFRAEFGSEMAVLHSGLTHNQKIQIWTEILQGRKHLVIGTRSAVFVPLPNLRMIILDEEHDSAYKQGENPKYHAREVARKRMENRGGIVILASATPSLEAYAASQTGKIGFITMNKRIGDSILPEVEIVDMRAELLNGNRSIFSLALQTKLREVLKRGEQAMLFMNRRGYSTFVVCRECGYVSRCPECDVALTYHSQGFTMRCHYCNHEEVPPHTCPECGSRYIRFFGQGTQRIEEELNGFFPEAKILRMDMDTTQSETGHRKILERFRRQEASILVGTQMIAKGLDFPNVTLVGVIAADQTLNMPDFRSRERTFQLLTQVAGRAGRGRKKGEVVVQTYSPADRAIDYASAHDFPGFFWEEIRYRKERQYPPFTHIIRVLLMNEKEEKVIHAAHALIDILRQGMTDSQIGYNELNILGPAPAVLPKIKNNYRWQVSVKGKSLNALRPFLHQGVQKFYNGPGSNGIVMNIEVDPLSS